MSLDEFSIIDNFFNRRKVNRDDVIVGIGDDAAIVKVPFGCELVLSIDTLVEGVHFPVDAPPEQLGYKSLAVNLSDLAAMGATPAWATLALTMPMNDPIWLKNFCAGFFSLLDEFNMQLIGGNLSRGPLAISCQVHGFVAPGKALLRSGAKTHDLIYVTGHLGAAGLALNHLNHQIQLPPLDLSEVFEKYYRPMPRIKVGLALLDLAHAAIDISDGLMADLGHLLEKSGKGALIYIEDLPLAACLKNNLSQDEAVQMALSAGDDYELCFTIPADKKLILDNKLPKDVILTCIGVVIEEPDIILQNKEGQAIKPAQTTGYRHFV